jgi:tRNA(fMet)-specific endonuclease VapC
MSLYVLDTDILTLLQHGHPTVSQHVSAHLRLDVTITVITVEEQLTGWYANVRRSKKKDTLARAYQHLADTTMYLSNMVVLSFTEPAIDRYEQLLRLKLKIGRQDLRIAAIALENAATLVTNNRRHFQLVPNLTLEDWTV